MSVVSEQIAPWLSMLLCRATPVRCSFSRGTEPPITGALLSRSWPLAATAPVFLSAGALWLFAAIACAASEIELKSGSTLTIRDTEYSRALPHVFHDQGMSSLPRLFPEHVLLASRRFGVLGEASYALLCFKENPSSERVIIQAVAVYRDRAWTLEAVASSSYGDTLVQVLEAIAQLPSKAGMQPTQTGAADANP